MQLGSGIVALTRVTRKSSRSTGQARRISTGMYSNLDIQLSPTPGYYPDVCEGESGILSVGILLVWDYLFVRQYV